MVILKIKSVKRSTCTALKTVRCYSSLERSYTTVTVTYASKSECLGGGACTDVHLAMITWFVTYSNQMLNNLALVKRNYG